MRIAATIEHAKHENLAGADAVVDRVGEARGERAMEARMQPMNATNLRQRINLLEKLREEIVAQPFPLPFVEPLASSQVLNGGAKDPDLHSDR